MSNYKVGRGKPPKETQFKKGASGNPRGRPKGSRNLKTIVMEQLLKPVTVTQNGKQTKVPALGALMGQTLKNGFKGDNKSTKMVLDCAMKLVGDEETTSSRDLRVGDQSPFDLTAEELESISKHKLLKGVK